MTLTRNGCRHHWHFVLPVLICLNGCDTQISSDASESIVYEITDPQIESFLQEMVENEHFAGVALVTKYDQIIHAKGYGLASPGIPNTVETVFHVASITKQFTAAATMQLVEAQVVDLDESINTYLPEEYTTPIWNAVTVHHLLSHSSGIPDYAVTRDYYDVVDGFCLGNTVDGMVREAMSKDLEFTPGAKYTYSNIGFTLLGLIIEHQTDTPYEQYMNDNVFDIMGMTSSNIHVEGHVPADNEALGHRWDEAKNRHVRDDIVSLPVTAPDGGLVTTLSDFIQWIQIYSGGRQTILSQESIDKMTSLQVAMGRGGSIDGYGYGLGVGERLIGHSGYIVGFRSRFDYDRETGTLVVLFTNNTSNNPGRISSGILTILFSPSP